VENLEQIATHTTEIQLLFYINLNEKNNKTKRKSIIYMPLYTS